LCLRIEGGIFSAAIFVFRRNCFELGSQESSGKNH
jgi:hypothetical protein